MNLAKKRRVDALRDGTVVTESRNTPWETVLDIDHLRSRRKEAQTVRLTVSIALVPLNSQQSFEI